MQATYTLNPEKNGIEIRFPEKPAAETLAALKGAGYRWSRAGGFWWSKQSEKALSVARAIVGGDVLSAPAQCAKAEKAAAKPATPSNVTPDGFRFVFNGYRTPAGELVKGRYSFVEKSENESQLFAVEMYLDSYGIPEHPADTIAENNSDGMTDYFETTRLYIPMTAPAYLAAVDGLKKFREHQNKTEVRRNARAFENESQKQEAEISYRMRLFGETREQAQAALKQKREEAEERERAYNATLAQCESLARARFDAMGTDQEAAALEAIRAHVSKHAAAFQQETEARNRAIKQHHIDLLRSQNPDNVREEAGLIITIRELKGYSLHQKAQVVSFDLSIYNADSLRQLFQKSFDSREKMESVVSVAIHQHQRKAQGLPATPGEHARAQLPALLEKAEAVEACASAEKVSAKAAVFELSEPLRVENAFFTCKSCDLGDMAHMLEVQDEGTPYHTGESVLVTHAVILPPDALAFFVHHLDEDFSFLDEKGGTRVESDTVSCWEEYIKLPTAEREKLPRYTLAVAVCDETGAPVLLVDPEGYTYARYASFMPEGFDFSAFDSLLRQSGYAPAIEKQPATPSPACNFESGKTRLPKALHDLLCLSTGTVATIAHEKGLPGPLADYESLQDIQSRLLFAASSLPPDRYGNWRELLEAAWPLAFPA